MVPCVGVFPSGGGSLEKAQESKPGISGCALMCDTVNALRVRGQTRASHEVAAAPRTTVLARGEKHANPTIPGNSVRNKSSWSDGFRWTNDRKVRS
jgi:hypothetical protein